MTTVSELYPDLYLRGVDIAARGPVKLVIGDLEVKQFQDPATNSISRKIVLFLSMPDGTPIAKRIVANKTQAKSLAAAYGQEIENWRGKPIVVAAGMTNNGMVTLVVTGVPTEAPAATTDIPF